MKIDVLNTFDLNKSLVSFGSSFKTINDNILKLKQLGNAIGQLIELIHEGGGY